MSSRNLFESCHRLTYFRAHQCCEQKAWVCQDKCQANHKPFSQTTELRIQTAQQIFSNMKRQIQDYIKVYTKDFSEIYTQIIRQLQKRKFQTERKLRKQIQEVLIKCLPISEQMYKKMERRQYKLINCSEVLSLSDQINFGQSEHYKDLSLIYQTNKTPLIKLKEALFDKKTTSTQQDRPNQSSRLQKSLLSLQVYTQTQQFFLTSYRRIRNYEQEDQKENQQQNVLKLKRKIRQLQEEKKCLILQTQNLQKQIPRKNDQQQYRPSPFIRSFSTYHNSLTSNQRGRRIQKNEEEKNSPDEDHDEFDPFPRKKQPPFI